MAKKKKTHEIMLTILAIKEMQIKATLRKMEDMVGNQKS
jgi:hypothetical protein